MPPFARRLTALAACLTLACVAFASPAGAAASTVPVTGTLVVRGANGSIPVPLVGRMDVDPSANPALTNIQFDPSYTASYAGPAGTIYYLKLEPFAVQQPAAAPGPSYTADLDLRLVVTVYLRTGPTQSPATDPVITNPGCEVSSTAPASITIDPVTTATSVSVPTLPAATFPAACGLAQSELNAQASGPHSLTFQSPAMAGTPMVDARVGIPTALVVGGVAIVAWRRRRDRPGGVAGPALA